MNLLSVKLSQSNESADVSKEEDGNNQAKKVGKNLFVQKLLRLDGINSRLINTLFFDQKENHYH